LTELEHHTVIIVGGGPAGLALSVVLGGWHPHYRESLALRERYPQIADFVAAGPDNLLQLRMRDLLQANLAPVDLFRLLHHPRQIFVELNQIAMEFRQSDPLDYLLITQEKVGGLWNNAPQNLLTLSPAHWMEFAFHPLAQYAQETGKAFGVNDLIKKTDLIDYYHSIPSRFEQEGHIHTQERVRSIEPDAKGFRITTSDVSGFSRGTARRTSIAPVPQPYDDVTPTSAERQYTCSYVVYATGQRCTLRRLDVEGEDLDFVDQYYDRAEDYDGDRVLVVGGGRSADWAATELHDAGKQVCYVTRQSRQRHWTLIAASRDGLPYYGRIAQILESQSPRLQMIYDARIQQIEPAAQGGRVTISTNGPQLEVEVDHVVKEIGAWTDYSPIQGFAPLQFVEAHDPYRFQLHQARTHPHNYESIDIPNLYMGGYLAQGVGLVVIAMHGCTYAIAADILQKESLL